MLDKKDKLALSGMIFREAELIRSYDRYKEQITEPQLLADLQGIIAQHRNRYNTMIDFSER